MSLIFRPARRSGLTSPSPLRYRSGSGRCSGIGLCQLCSPCNIVLGCLYMRLSHSPPGHNLGNHWGEHSRKYEEQHWSSLHCPHTCRTLDTSSD
jgi:hypothetical protein